jgi:hypothetical protein
VTRPRWLHKELAQRFQERVQRYGLVHVHGRKSQLFADSCGLLCYVDDAIAFAEREVDRAPKRAKG